MSEYSVQSYGNMIADPVRMGAFTGALEQAIKPGSVVLDIGTGTGVFAMLACRYGAARVYALEPTGVIEIAREVARANGFADRITFLRQLSTEVELPERADVIVSDLRGLLPWFEQHIPSIVDARQRLLKEGGRLIPQRDMVYASIVEAPELHAPLLLGHGDNRFGFDMSAAERIAVNQVLRGRVLPHQLLAAPARVGELDYMEIVDPGVTAELSWEVQRDGTVYGLCLWFERELGYGFSESHAPGTHPGELPPLVHGNMFLPFSRPVAVRPGDRAEVRLTGVLDRPDYTWTWATKIVSSADDTICLGEFVQSTLIGQFTAPPEVAMKEDEEFEPLLGRNGRALGEILSMMDGETELSKIAQTLVRRFPDLYPSVEEALEPVVAASRSYGE